jgi:hypothetical protein
VAQDLLVTLQPEGTQEDGPGDLPLAVDADVQDFLLLVVLELHPRASIRDDLRQEGPWSRLGEEDSGGAMQLADDDAFRTVDDEGAGIRHQRDVAEVDLFLLGVTHHALPGLRVLVIDEEAEGDLQRHRIGHAAFLTLGDRVGELQIHGIAARFAAGHAIAVHDPTAPANHRLLMRVIRHDLRAAVGTGHAQVFETL